MLLVMGIFVGEAGNRSLLQGILICLSNDFVTDVVDDGRLMVNDTEGVHSVACRVCGSVLFGGSVSVFTTVLTLLSFLLFSIRWRDGDKLFVRGKCGILSDASSMSIACSDLIVDFATSSFIVRVFFVSLVSFLSVDEARARFSGVFAACGKHDLLMLTDFNAGPSVDALDCLKGVHLDEFAFVWNSPHATAGEF